ncbi:MULTISPECIES: SGNH/GDSL hydrolase family protein [Paenibacillus]|uniref:Lipolytic protein G-D-S-L family n=1 Tax=Paenibacillus lactis 154 TaxID=743719 RepID=G4H9A0_9BACL|nr:SGNH/GDSL hydrolase family protein [Paenibacillus lactis]EHB68435.1 lipolytic protein G-D-S-L family [Paenibacillus lactis 154]
MRGRYASLTVVSTATNFIMEQEDRSTRTYRTYMKPRESGQLELRFWHSNSVDSTWDVGSVAKGSMPGGAWRIEAAYAADGGTGRDGQLVPGTSVQITFDRKPGKEVAPGETFWSDPVQLELPDGHDLAFTWTITTRSPGKTVPYNTEGLLVSAYEAEGNLADDERGTGFMPAENRLVMPAFIGYARPVKQRMIFLGDSITQGVRTAKDGYEYWVSRIADGLSPDYSVWNLGSGWARAYDASADGPWLAKAAEGDIVAIALGVNDIDIGARSSGELLDDLSAIVRRLKQREDGTKARIILFTVAPFNFTGDREEVWRTVNEVIRTRPPEGVDAVFDIAEILSCPAPEEHRIEPKYMSFSDDPHPNGLAGAVVAEAFLKWFEAQPKDQNALMQDLSK